MKKKILADFQICISVPFIVNVESFDKILFSILQIIRGLTTWKNQRNHSSTVQIRREAESIKN